MRRYLATAPPWVVTALTGVFYVVWLTIGDRDTNYPHSSWLSSFVLASLVAVTTAPFTWRGIQRSRQTVDSITGPLTPEQKNSVYRAAAKGAAPADPSLRQAALDLARYRLDRALRQRTGMLLLGIIGAVVCAAFAVSDRSLWFAACAVIIAEALVEKVSYPARQHRRIARLEQSHAFAG